MKLTIITVGKNHDKNLRESIEDYIRRLSKHNVVLDWQFIPSSTKSTESNAIVKQCQGYVVLLDETGVLQTSTEFSVMLEQRQNLSTKQLTFIIGGAFGVNDDVKKRADFTWSLSPLVFPHQLVRLVLVEQLYRAYDILAGGKYHHS